jgi:hypothetical protein
MPASSTSKSILYPNASWYFLLAMITTWVGFSTSYFGQLNKNDIFHHIHGATAGLWMLLLIVQPILYKKGKLTLHRKLGKYASIVLVPLLILGGIKMIQLMIRAQPFYPPHSVYQLSFCDVCSLGMFIFFFSASLWYGANINNHARYMACTVLIILPPAIGRALFFIPWFNTFNRALNGSFVIVELVLLLLLADDKRLGQIRKPYLVALGLFALLHILFNFADGWVGWHSAMDRFAAMHF